MTYEKCPHCGETRVRQVREGVVECVSCRTPLRESWISEELAATAAEQ